MAKQDHGWAPMPTALKILFGLGTLSFLLVLAGFLINLSGGYTASLLGMEVGGAAGLFVDFLYVALTGVFLYALWFREEWGWKYGIAFFAFSAVNNLLLINRLGLGSQLFGLVINAVIIYFIYKHKDYFE